MPRISPLTENARKDQALKAQLYGCMKAERITNEKMAKMLGISVNTFIRRKQAPDSLTLRERRILQKIFPGIVIE